jgi:hypothetical protein
MKISASLLFLLFSIYSYGQITISGKLVNQENGEDLIFASVSVKGTTHGVSSNEYGFYSLTIKPAHIKEGKVTIVVSYLGFEKQEYSLDAIKNVRLDVKLKNKATQLKSFKVIASKTDKEAELRSPEMSITRIQVKNITKLPSISGEVDIIKVMQLLPGVSGGLEGTTGMFVRGGDADQNLVLIDESTVYNIGHLFGFFSVFNPDAIKDMTIIKGAFPSNYGGRLSSILDIKMKEGHDKKIHGQGGIGLLSSRLTLEGPIVKEKASFLISGRRTYIDQVFKISGSNLPYYFYDFNGKVNVKLNKNNRLFYSTYLGKDILSFNSSNENGNSQEESDEKFGFGFKLGNHTNSLRWNHIYNEKLFSNLSFISTSFKYDILGSFGSNNISIRSNIIDLGLKADYDWYKSEKNHIKFGGAFTNHVFKPNIVNTTGEINEFLKSNEGERLTTQEVALYTHSEYDISSLLKIKAGARFSGALATKKFYTGFEPRISGRYMLSKNDAIKASYSRMKQYMHRVSSSTVTLPTDLWYPITDNIKPQKSDQIAIGYNHLFKKVKTLFELEAYYKWMDNLIEYKEGSNLILNNNFEEELLQGKGHAYGIEALFKKDEGKLTGWVSYTLSWTKRNFDELNGGEEFWAKYDRRHVGSIVLNYQITKRFNFSTVWVYQTGSRFTAQTGQYFMPNATLSGVDVIPIYTKRNEVQMSPSHRLDVNFTFSSKPDKKFKSEWSFGAYNIYNRAAPYQVKVVPTDDGQSVGYKYTQPGLFGFIPSIAYNFNF